ncbi:hypothetical protein RJ640_012565 [Escallonia rubra]|uniref:NAD(P)H-quinone oxidoreductase subunit 5, chloroplastic n=1 Tax=Escallonia rubra TaxID=112253 RepID=A0AA88QI52_9ASTE|nr:hypothetical protein RJ640_012565 [Escallonia rubra]
MNNNQSASFFSKKRYQIHENVRNMRQPFITITQFGNNKYFSYPYESDNTINKMTTILGIHLILLGIGAFLLVFKALYFGGVYDTWAPGGGDVRKITNLTLSPSIIFGYLLKSPFGGEGWIVSVDDLEDIMGHKKSNGSNT